MASTPIQIPTQVANLALAHCGVSKPIANLDTTKSLEAEMCRTFFDLARQATLREFGWMFAVRQVQPALVANQPTSEWNYAYQYPSDALRLTRFMSWRLQNDTRQSRVEFTIMQPVAVGLSTLATPPTTYNASGMWIYTNWPGQAIAMPTVIEYIFDNQNVSQWTPEFIISVSLKLASFIVPSVTTGDPASYKQKIDDEYSGYILKAKATNMNEEQRPEEPDAEWIRAREGEAFGIPGMSWVSEPAGFQVL